MGAVWLGLNRYIILLADEAQESPGSQLRDACGNSKACNATIRATET